MTPDPQKNLVPRRLESLDALRGFDMFWIIGGGAMFMGLDPIFHSSCTRFLCAQLDHVEWIGFSFWDIIMPLFLFIVGTAIPFSTAKRLAMGQTRKKLYFHLIRRVILLWILGTIAQGNLLAYDLSKLRLYSNTLQAIAAGYLIATVAFMNLDMKKFTVLLAGLLLAFWAVMTWVPVPGFGPGVLTADGNLANYLDRLLLGRFDDGLDYTWILSSLNFGSTVMLGVIAGKLLQSSRTQEKKALWLLGLGIGCAILGLVWGIGSPIIKKLWTGSFTLFSGGLCFLLLAAFYWIIDVLDHRAWAFGFKVIGVNAIAVYMATHVFDFRHLGNIFVGGLSNRLGTWNELAQSAAAFAAVWLILYWMYRKKTFIKI